MDTAHFHTGIEEEDTGSKHHVVEVGQVGEEAAVEIQVGVSASGKVDNTQDNQQCGRDNSPTRPPTFATLPTQLMPFMEMNVASQ